MNLLEQTIADAYRFIAEAELALVARYPSGGSAARGSTKAASILLTRSLARLRQTYVYDWHAER